LRYTCDTHICNGCRHTWKERFCWGIKKFN